MASATAAPPPRRASPISVPIRLAGPSLALDRRVHAYRDDLADIALADRVVASHYAEPVTLQGGLTGGTIHASPTFSAVGVSELLPGETFLALEIGSDWTWGYCAHDRYVGHIRSDALIPPTTPTHRVTAPLATVFAGPDVQAPVLGSLPMGALVAAEPRIDSFHASSGGFIHRRHLGALKPQAGDPVDIARTFLGSPYVWGGRTRAGVDCSGLIQLALMSCGHPCPRDSDQQREAVGREVGADDLQRGDVVFFPGHVGMMVDETRVIHANSFWMSTVIEPLADMLARIGDERPLAARRL